MAIDSIDCDTGLSTLGQQICPRQAQTITLW